MREVVPNQNKPTESSYPEWVNLPRGLLVPPRLLLDPLYRCFPDYFNVEATLPCQVGTDSFVDPRFDSTSLRDSLRKNLRVIVPKNVADSWPGNIEILTSPYECGRVLESRETIVFEGRSHVLLLKGVGATSFVRDARPTDWNGIRDLYGVGFSYTPGEATAFSKDGLGVMDRRHADKAVKISQEMEALGIDAERTVAYFPIEAIPVEGGRWLSISEMKRRNLMSDLTNPVISMRIVKSNYRLQEVRMLWELDGYDYAEPFLDHCVKKYREETGSQGGLQSYYDWLANKVLSQESQLIFRGYRLGSTQHGDTKRNISILGEELDLESFNRDMAYDQMYIDPQTFEQFHRDATVGFASVVQALRIFAFEIRELSKNELGLDGLRESVIQSINSQLDRRDTFARDLASRMTGIDRSARDQLVDNLKSELIDASLSVIKGERF